MLLCAACVQSEVVSNDEDVLLVFDPILNEISKSAASPGEFPSGQDFGVDVWDYPAGAETSLWEEYLMDARVARSGNEWKPGGNVLWPERTRHIAVLAHSPFGKASSVGLEKGVEFKDVDVTADQTDLLYCELVRDQAKSGTVVSVPFRHALCHIDFAMRTNALSSENVEVKSVSVKYFCTQGNFRSIPTPEWALTGQMHQVEFFSGSVSLGSLNRPLEPGLWTIPQYIESVVNVKLDYTDTNGILLHLDLDSEPLKLNTEAGRQYSVTMAFVTDDLSLRLDEQFKKDK